MAVHKSIEELALPWHCSVRTSSALKKLVRGDGLWYTKMLVCGRVAQLDRALASEAKGRGFKSRLVHHT